MKKVPKPGTKPLDKIKAALITQACVIAHLRDGDRCSVCCKTGPGKYDASHLYPRTRGWRYAMDPRNIVIMCSICHAFKWHGHGENHKQARDQVRRNRPDFWKIYQEDEYDGAVPFDLDKAEYWHEKLHRLFIKHGGEYK